MKGDIPFHEVANLFPMMRPGDFADLKADIQANGHREPVWTWKGKIIDGRNRYRACRELGIEPTFREWGGEGSLLSFVLSLNLHRRHLTSSQRAAIAAESIDLFASEAKARQRAGGRKGGKAKDSQKIDHPSNVGKATAEAARAVGTNRSYVAEMVKLREKSPRLFEEVKEGVINVSQARGRLKLEEQERREQEARSQQQSAKVVSREPSRSDFELACAEVSLRPEYRDRVDAMNQMEAVAKKESQEDHRQIEELYQRIQERERKVMLAQNELQDEIESDAELLFCWCGSRNEDGDGDGDECKKHSRDRLRAIGIDPDAPNALELLLEQIRLRLPPQWQQAFDDDMAKAAQ